MLSRAGGLHLRAGRYNWCSSWVGAQQAHRWHCECPSLCSSDIPARAPSLLLGSVAQIEPKTVPGPQRSCPCLASGMKHRPEGRKALLGCCLPLCPGGLSEVWGQKVWKEVHPEIVGLHWVLKGRACSRGSGRIGVAGSQEPAGHWLLGAGSSSPGQVQH